MPATIKRGFADTAVGQVHYRMTRPTGVTARPLVMFHGSPSSSLSLVRLMAHLGESRTVIAFDTMGFFSIFGNPLLAMFIKSDITLIELVKGFFS